MIEATTQEAAIYSSFGNDACLRELVEMYVMEMPDRIAALEAAFSNGSMETLIRAAHQMKGAAGSYGFNQLTPVAARLESSARNKESKENIQLKLEALIYLCRQVRAGVPECE